MGSSSRYRLLRVRCVGGFDCGDGVLIPFTSRALTALSSTNIAATKVKRNKALLHVEFLTPLLLQAGPVSKQVKFSPLSLVYNPLQTSPIYGTISLFIHPCAIHPLCHYLVTPISSTPQIANHLSHPLFPQPPPCIFQEGSHRSRNHLFVKAQNSDVRKRGSPRELGGTAPEFPHIRTTHLGIFIRSAVIVAIREIGWCGLRLFPTSTTETS